MYFLCLSGVGFFLSNFVGDEFECKTYLDQHGVYALASSGVKNIRNS